MNASAWPSHGMRYGTNGGSPGINLVEEANGHHHVAKRGSTSKNQMAGEFKG